MLKTRITEILGIRYPIVQGALMQLSKAEFVSAVSNAGGLGILSSPTFTTKEEFRQEVRKTKNLCSEPFGVNIVFLPTTRKIPNDDYIDVIIEEEVKVVETVGRIQPSLIERLHKANVICLHKVTSVQHAVVAERENVDAVTVEGWECAGHPGMDRVGSLVLIQRVIQEVKIPVIAAGGFVDGKGLIAALALGAEGILMGTRFLVTKECPVHHNIKERCVKAKETDTVFCLSSFRDPVRYMKTDLAERVLGMETRGADLQEILTIINGERYSKVLESGDFGDGVLTCGQCVGLIQDVPSVKELVDRIILEAVETKKRLSIMA